jgi:hypothetical protein
MFGKKFFGNGYALPLLFAVVVPSTIHDVAAPKEIVKLWLDLTIKVFEEIFGACSTIKQSGHWNGIKENSVIVYAFADESIKENEEAYRKLQSHCFSLQASLEQECLAVVIDGEFLIYDATQLSSWMEKFYADQTANDLALLQAEYDRIDNERKIEDRIRSLESRIAYLESFIVGYTGKPIEQVLMQ